MDRKIIRPRQIAATLGVSKRTALRMLEDGRLIRVQLSRRCVGTYRDELQKFLDRAEFRGLED